MFKKRRGKSPTELNEGERSGRARYQLKDYNYRKLDKNIVDKGAFRRD